LSIWTLLLTELPLAMEGGAEGSTSLRQVVRRPDHGVAFIKLLRDQMAHQSITALMLQLIILTASNAISHRHIAWRAHFVIGGPCHLARPRPGPSASSNQAR